MILDSSDGCGIQVVPILEPDQFIAEKLLEIQWLQEQHDQIYHKDIYQLRPIDKLTHFALHMGKYSGTLFELHQADHLREFRRKVVDVLIICTSIANTLQVNLGKHTAEQLKQWSDRGLMFNNIDEYSLRLSNTRMHGVRQVSTFDLLIKLTGEVAVMADAITEFTDGLLTRSPRVEISVAVADAWMTALALYHSCQQAGDGKFPWAAAIMNRLIDVEKKNMFYKFLPKRAGSYVGRHDS